MHQIENRKLHNATVLRKWKKIQNLHNRMNTNTYQSKNTRGSNSNKNFSTSFFSNLLLRHLAKIWEVVMAGEIYLIFM